jgi:trehalose-phosphatase
MRRLAAASWTVVVISGRPWRQVREMVPIAEVPVFGCHGAEGTPDGSSPGPPPDREISDRLERIASRLDAIAGPFPGSLIERKPLGIVAHHRKVAPERLEAWHRELHACLESLELRGLELLEGRKIHEVRVAGAGKDRLVQRFAAIRGVTAFDASFVALGDDRTDEEMFRAIRGLGLSVAVGGEEAGIRARRRLQGPAEVRIFLENLSLPLPNRSVGP